MRGWSMESKSIFVYGAPWCGDCHRSRRLLEAYEVSFQWIDIDERPEFQEVVRSYNSGKQIIPTLVFADGTVLSEPTDAQLKAKLGV